MHTADGNGGARENSAFQGYRRAVYAVTSSVTATSLNSGFVQIMRLPPDRVRSPIPATRSPGHNGC